ncbi:MAG: hypothetical protein A2992_07065 [Elusimicrobia bacterium RIFCSPLOWO2_01_FULL_59_12]|nr:MAG: hypothetical protein A2992_07065 [Elusimicrobia bacterium RIFCSPLOWO2_01_FULL_59_12]
MKTFLQILVSCTILVNLSTEGLLANRNPKNLLLPAVAEKTKPAVVRIERLIFDEYEQGRLPKFSGSGVLVSPQGHILTCAHVLRHDHVVRVILWDGTQAKARVVSVDATNDLALLQLIHSKKETPFVGFASPARLDEPVYVIGHPLGLPWEITFGVITHLSGTLLQSDAQVHPGSSGGGVFSAEGKLTALTQAVLESAPSTSEAILIDGQVCQRFWQNSRSHFVSSN